MTLFDSHCHFDFDAFKQNRERLWSQCNNAGVSGLLIPGVAPAQWPSMLNIAERFTGIFCAAGLHPWWIDRLLKVHASPEYMIEAVGDAIEHVLNRNPKLCAAVGECGLDKYIDTPMALQRLVFDRHIEIACRYQLPLIVHVRGEHQAVIRTLKHYRPVARGVIHGFSGSSELAAQYWSLGFHLGIGGTITYDRAKKTRRAVQDIPLEAILLETDAPDMPLQGYQGQPNTPLQIPMIAEVLADLKGLPVADIARQTTDNSCRLLGV